jgi:hypothetical protein
MGRVHVLGLVVLKKNQVILRVVPEFVGALAGSDALRHRTLEYWSVTPPEVGNAVIVDHHSNRQRTLRRLQA